MDQPRSAFVAATSEAQQFRRALRHFATGVSVITIFDGAEVHGMTASSFTSVSLDPPLCSVAVNKPGRMHELLLAADGHYGLSILRNDQGHIADYFARRPWSVPIDVKLDWSDGCPTIAGSLAWFRCVKWSEYDGGDHTIFVGRALDHGDDDSDDAAPLLWHKSQYHDLGTQLARGDGKAVVDPH
ncbi:flavin reductase family protein [Pseudonocardia sp. GCM10023141]|uniref:flavin reductase family protein n=1 Tax=Pseudonocardia sp. GCM10023141 TaxID=3252653 RepID=UPI003607B089